MLEKVKQIEGDMRKDLNIKDETEIIAEEPAYENEKSELLQGEIEALRREVDKLSSVAIKICELLEQTRTESDRFCV